MPTILNPQNQEELDENGNPVAQISGATNQAVVGSGASSGPAPEAGKPTQSGSWSNLQSYLTANKGNGFGEQFAGKVGAEADNASAAQSAAQSNVKQQVDAGTTQWNPDLVNAAVNDPSNFVQDSGKVQQFTQQRDAQYKGPQQFADTQDYTDAYSKTEKAAQAADQSKTEAGRKALLSNYYARPDYYAGMKNLDNLIIQNDDDSRPALAQAQSKATAAKNAFNPLAEQLNAYAKQGADQTAMARNQTRGALGLKDDGTVEGGAIGGLNSQVNEAVTNRRTQFDTDQRPRLMEALQTGDLSKLTPEERQIIGLDSQVNAPVYHTNFDFLKDSLDTSGYGRLSAGTVATKDQQQRMAALSQLAGIENTFLPDADLAGTQDDEALFGYRSADAINQIGDARSKANDQINNSTYNFTDLPNPISNQFSGTAAPNELQALLRRGGIAQAGTSNSISNTLRDIDQASADISQAEQWQPAFKAAMIGRLAEYRHQLLNHQANIAAQYGIANNNPSKDVRLKG